MLVILLSIVIALFVPFAVAYEIELKNRASRLSPNAIYVEDFEQYKREAKLDKYKEEGVYVFTNLSKADKKYVGQSVDIVNRVDTHLSGRGNKLIYSDIIKGDKLIVEFIKLKDSGYKGLNSLERSLIARYNSYNSGYNKTRGNR